MIRLGIAALALLAAVPAQAAAKPTLEGVWKGTIGKLPVQVCLAVDSTDWARGSYYYHSQKVPIRLERAEKGKHWQETGEKGAAARWDIANAGPARVTGKWSKGKTVLPIALTRVAMGDDGELDGPCQSNAYFAPRVTAPQVAARPVQGGKLTYTRLDYTVGKQFAEVEIASFQLPMVQPGDKAINAALRALIDPKSDTIDYLGCMKGSVALSGVDGEMAMVAVPSFVSDDWVAVSIASMGSCGGAHPYSDNSHRLFDRRSGKEVELGLWLAPKGMTVEREAGSDWADRRITEALRNLVVTRFKFDGEAECRDVVGQATYWDIALTPTGIAFEPSLPHVAQACGEYVTLTFADLAPFLSDAGKAGVARMQGPVLLQ